MDQLKRVLPVRLRGRRDRFAKLSQAAMGMKAAGMEIVFRIPVTVRYEGIEYLELITCRRGLK